MLIQVLRNRVRVVAVVFLVAAAIVSACASNGFDPRLNCSFDPGQQVEIDGRFYSPQWGSIRSDMIRTEALSPVELKLEDNRECPSQTPDNLHEIAGIDIEQMFVEIRGAKSSAGGSFPRACHHTNEVYTFAAVGATEPAPPFGRPAQTPWSEGSPTPVPTPPQNGPIVDLSPQGLLDSGWPIIHLPSPDGRNVTWDSGIRVTYKGREYRFSGNSPIGDIETPRRLPVQLMDQIDIVFVRYTEDRWPAGLVASMPHLLTDGEIEDRVKLYRPLDRSSEEVIIVDPCPTYPDDLQPDNIVFWGRISDRSQP